jgi:hypothetical protein
LKKCIDIIERYEKVFEDICKIKYVKNPDKDLMKLKIEEIRELKLSEIYTKIVIDYLFD